MKRRTNRFQDISKIKICRILNFIIYSLIGIWAIILLYLAHHQYESHLLRLIYLGLLLSLPAGILSYIIIDDLINGEGGE